VVCAAQIGTEQGRAQTAAATEARKFNVARRAVDDPVVLAKAARIVRIALARRVLTPADLEPRTPAERAKAERAS
jgi:hypothetical protein